MALELICKNCRNEYNELDHCPLILSCCCDYCKECIKTMYVSRGSIKCPKHGIIKEKSIGELAKSPQLMEMIKLKKRDSIFKYESSDQRMNCIRHQKNKIRYVCEECNQFLCKECFVNHSNHECHDCLITQKSFYTEVKAMEKLIQAKKEEFEIFQENIDKSNDAVANHYQCQKNMVENYFNSIIQTVLNIKKKIILKIASFADFHKQKFDALKDINLSMNKEITKMMNTMSEIKNNIYTNGEYETFYKIKKRIKNQLDSQEIPLVKVPPLNEFPKFSVSNCLNNLENEKFYGLFKNTSNDKLNILDVNEIKPRKAVTENNQNNQIRNEESTMTSFFKKNKDEENNIFKHNLFEDNVSHNKKEFSSIDTNNYKPTYNNPLRHLRPYSGNSNSPVNKNCPVNTETSQRSEVNINRGLSGSKNKKKNESVFSFDPSPPKRLNTSSNKEEIKSRKIFTEKSTIEGPTQYQSQSQSKSKAKNNPQSSRELQKLCNALGNFQIHKPRNLSSGKPSSPKSRVLLQKQQQILVNSKIGNENNKIIKNSSNTHFERYEPKDSLYHNQFSYINQIGNKNNQGNIYKPNCIVKNYSNLIKINTDFWSKQGTISNDYSMDIRTSLPSNTFESEGNVKNKRNIKSSQKNTSQTKEIFKKKQTGHKFNANSDNFYDPCYS